jgi:hypothetical protein
MGRVVVNVNLDGGPGAHDALGDDADAGGADMVDGGGQFRIPLGQKGGFSFGADRFFGEVMIFRGHEEEIGGRAGEL